MISLRGDCYCELNSISLLSHQQSSNREWIRKREIHKNEYKTDVYSSKSGTLSIKMRNKINRERESEWEGNKRREKNIAHFYVIRFLYSRTHFTHQLVAFFSLFFLFPSSTHSPPPPHRENFYEWDFFSVLQLLCKYLTSTPHSTTTVIIIIISFTSFSFSV